MKSTELARLQFVAIDAISWLIYSGARDMAHEKMELYCERGKLTREMVVHMWAVLMSNVAAAAGVTLSVWACVKAFQWAGKTGNFKSEREAADSQEVWEMASNYQRDRFGD